MSTRGPKEDPPEWKLRDENAVAMAEFVCPVCGDTVAGGADLLICDECLTEALAIRVVAFLVGKLEGGR